MHAHVIAQGKKMRNGKKFAKNMENQVETSHEGRF